jgi:GH35 family endo-1,4-beta-xylanase
MKAAKLLSRTTLARDTLWLVPTCGRPFCASPKILSNSSVKPFSINGSGFSRQIIKESGKGTGPITIHRKLLLIVLFLFACDYAIAELSLHKTVYVDGQYLDSAIVSGSGLSYPYDHFILGAEGSVGWRYNELDGTLDEVAIYDGILSSSRILTHYNAIATNYFNEVMADNPLGYWRFEDATSNNGDPVEDWGNVGRDGTYVDSVSLVPGVLGQAARLHGLMPDGAGDCISIWDGDGAFSLEDITVEVWINSSNLGSNYPRLFQHNGNWLEPDGYGLMCTESLFGVIGANTIDYFAVDVNDGLWHHVVVTYETLGEIGPEIGAANLIFKSIGSTHDSNGWILSENGYVGTFIDVNTAGTVTITISADGSLAGGQLPIMHLHIGDCSEEWTVADNGGSHTTYSNYIADFNLPAGMHAVRIEFVNDYTTSGDRNLYLKSVTFDGATIRNSASSANALAAADNYIENYRKGPATVNFIIGQTGSVPEGTEVQVKLRRHTFNFGTEVYGLWDMPWAEPDPTPGSDNYNYQQFINTHFNMILPGNAGKWRYNEYDRDVVTMQAVDDMLDYADAHGLRARMHGVLWDYDDQEPDWVNTLQNQALTDPCAAAEYWDEIIERIQYFVGERGGRFTDIDGINESYHKPKNTDIFGIEGVAQLYNEMTAASAGRAKIAVNEYSVLEWTDYTNWYREHIENIVNSGGTVEFIGLQNHTSSGGYNTIAVFKNLQLFAGFELPMKITEFSLDSPSSTILTDTMRLCFGNDMTDGFIMWGFWKEQMWRDGSALVDENWDLTDMGVAYEQLMAQWDTNEVVYVNADSQINFAGYYGDYDITINDQVYTLTLTKDTTTYDLQIPCTSQFQGDIYQDCYVDELDLLLFANEWLQEPADADLNDDNDVDFGDFAFIGNDWRLCTDPTNPGCLSE